ncbi:MAG: S41 family peptidase [Dysgonamonadaceae bacterium]|jgi:carboxyl-terminal processing protease|nr:S41 family peptidase [Dysgonamonadaceae bacterium]
MKSFWKFVLSVVIPALIIGFIAGIYFSNSGILGRRFFVNTDNKIGAILNIVDRQYVDTINMKDLVEDAIPNIIYELDPHSAYIPAQDLQSVNEDLEGHFSGIGIQFNRQNDTITVISVISGGPSEKAGIQSGDRIVTIDDSLYVGLGFSDEKIVKTLRGPKGTKVKVGIKRSGAERLQVYEITRGDVPVNTVDAAYEADSGIGLIKINKFGKTTYPEFLSAVGILTGAGCRSFILDLRQNPGGLLESAIEVSNEFLPGNRLIVYAEGRMFARNETYSNGTGICQSQPLVVLVDEMSASAAEIVAGAIQDNDRGTIIGRRSFGKGLVQNQVQLSDSSALRLTIARYYTPSGRCIQKEYKMGDRAEYDRDLINRFKHGEFDSKDSIKNSANMFKTRLGRPVYDGGGITPDIFIPRDTLGVTSYYSALLQNGIIYDYAFLYTDRYRATLSKFDNYNKLWNYLKTQPLLDGVVNHATGKGIRPRPLLIVKSAPLIEKLTQAAIVRNIFGDKGFYPVFLDKDPSITTAIEIIKAGNAFPKGE